MSSYGDLCRRPFRRAWRGATANADVAPAEPHLNVVDTTHHLKHRLGQLKNGSKHAQRSNRTYPGLRSCLAGDIFRNSADRRGSNPARNLWRPGENRWSSRDYGDTLVFLIGDASGRGLCSADER
jgi:hypothetical protein